MRREGAVEEVGRGVVDGSNDNIVYLRDVLDRLARRT